MKAACAGTRSVRLQNSEAGVPKRQPKEDTNQKCYISRISFPIIFSRPTSELVSQIDSGPVRNQESRLLKSKKTLERKNNLLNLLEKEFVTLKLEDLKNKNRKAESPKRKILHRAYPSSISLRKPSEERLKSHDDFKKSDTSNESIQ